MIRLKHNGQTFVFNSDSRWPVAQGDIVGVYHRIKKIALNHISVLAVSKTEDYNLARSRSEIYNRTNEPKQRK
jgi:hypothetical protein